MPYTDQQGLEGYLGRGLTEAEATIATNVIDAVTSWIDQYIGTSYSQSTDPSTRLYDGGEKYIFIDPATDITLVELLSWDGTLVQAYDDDQWIAYPANFDTKTSIRLVGGYRWPRGEGVIRVTATWGEGGGEPEDLRYAANVLACQWLQSGPKNLVREEIEGYTRFFAPLAQQNPEIMTILDARRRVYL